MAFVSSIGALNTAGASASSMPSIKAVSWVLVHEETTWTNGPGRNAMLIGCIYYRYSQAYLLQAYRDHVASH